MAELFLALGSNIGNRRANLRAALRALRGPLQGSNVSPLYESAPVGVETQPAFLNAVLRGMTTLSPEAVLETVKVVEWQLGRRPSQRWGPRPLDIDLLLYDDLQLATPRLRLPHERLRERGFVLRPLADLAPDLGVPPDGARVAELLARIATDDLTRVAGPEWAEA